ncbi:hypothetical protein WBP07_12960 [Novosphingobium sp. BL-8A]|uniref:hypothetical protein n=1 Tax=Novosphingobium sp. BL-8A TaxID=3127639 RepID=UPI0037571FD9
MIEIPSRYSVDQEDFDPDLGQRLVIALDGIDQYGRVHSYDIEAGTVTRCKRDDSGQAYVGPGTDDIAMETIHGVVSVTLKPEGQ